MRTYDLIRPYLDVDRVLDCTSPELNLRQALRVPTEVEYLQVGSAGTAKAESRDLLCVATGSDADGLADRLHGLPVGATVLVLFDWAGADLAYHRLLDVVGLSGCQVLQYATLDFAPNGGLVVRRTDCLLPVRDVLGRAPAFDEPVGRQTDRADMAIRMASEYVFADVLVRHQRRQIQDRDARIERLERTVAEREQRLAEVEGALRRVETLDYQARVGRQMIAAADHPARHTAGLARVMFRLWRERKASGP